jgi:hypothetical protein
VIEFSASPSYWRWEGLSGGSFDFLLPPDGGAALALTDVKEINMTFDFLTSTNNLSSQIGATGDDGIDLLLIDAGTLDVTGTTTVKNAAGEGISVSGVGATITFDLVDLDGIGLDAVISGVAHDNPGIPNINGGTDSAP